MPRPTMRGCRTHQKASTRAVNSGTRRRSLHGMKSITSAAAKESATVLSFAGIRMARELSNSIAVLLPRAFVLLLHAAPLVGEAALPGLRLLGPRRAHGVV